MASAANFLVVSIAALCFILPCAVGCAVPPYGCSKDLCRSLRNPPPVAKPLFNKDLPATWDTRLGFWMGLYNKRYSNRQKQVLLHEKGGPSVNYESFSEIGYVLKYSTATSLRACCDECRVTTGCWVYQYFDAESATGRLTPTGFKKGVRCYLLKGGRETQDDWSGRGTPFSGKHSEQVLTGDSYSPKYNPSWVGGLCNGNASVVDDPHFTGAQGTPFDFNGRLATTFCLTTDAPLHINVLLNGYADESGAGDKAVRSWIKEIGILWREENVAAAAGAAGNSMGESKVHSLRLVAREGKQQESGENGFLEAVFVDGEHVAAPNAAHVSLASHGMRLEFLGTGKTGPYDVDRFSLTVGSLLDMGLSMRVAHPKLQTASDAQAHFNVVINDMAASAAVHGVLGQTYRATREQQLKALKYSQISRLLHGRIAADGESGKGFLEGSVGDYVTSGIMSSDCKFSAFTV